jgi:hypothetical protein
MLQQAIVRLSIRLWSLRGELAEISISVLRDILDPYRPELYYMRGPGPKWRAKNNRR